MLSSTILRYSAQLVTLFNFNFKAGGGVLLRLRLSIFQLCYVFITCHLWTLALPTEILKESAVKNYLSHLARCRCLQGGDFYCYLCDVLWSMTSPVMWPTIGNDFMWKMLLFLWLLLLETSAVTHRNSVWIYSNRWGQNDTVLQVNQKLHLFVLSGHKFVFFLHTNSRLYVYVDVC
jgi:hypothetical protein